MLDRRSLIAGILLHQHLLIRLLLALLATCGALIIGEKINFGEYLTTDENSYLFQAWLFLQGKLRLPCPPIEDALFHRMIICDDQVGWVSRYAPGHSAWLMPGVALGYPRLMSALAAFLTVWFLAAAGEKLKIPSWCTGLPLIVSPYFWLMWGSVLSHTSGLAATSIMLWAYLAWIDDRKQAFAVIAGLAWAFLFLNRSYTALWFALPFAVDALRRLSLNLNRLQLQGTILFAACAGLGIVLYLMYNHLITGDALLPPFLHYNPTEGPGFHTVNGREHTPAIGWSFLKYNFTELNTNLWGFSGSMLAWLVLSLIGWKKMLSPLLLSATFLVWFGYAAFWFRGILELPPIYYYETLAFMALTAGMGLHRLFTLQWPIPHWGKQSVAIIIVIVVLHPAIHTFQKKAQVISKRTHYTHRFQKVIHDVPPGSIVVLGGLHKDILAQNSWNPHGLDSEPLILRDVHGITQLIPRLFPERPVYLVSGKTPAPARGIPTVRHLNRSIPAPETKAKTGENVDSLESAIRFAEKTLHRKGKLGYGVKQYLLPGSYTIRYLVKATGNQNEVPGYVDVIDVADGQQLSSRKLSPGETHSEINIDVGKITLVEPRVFFSGQGKLEFQGIEIEETISTFSPGVPPGNLRLLSAR